MMLDVKMAAEELILAQSGASLLYVECIYSLSEMNRKS